MLHDQILKAFRPLFEDFGFSLVAGGNQTSETVAIAESRDLRVRFICDRADFFVDVAKLGTTEKWTPIYDVLDELKRAGKIEDDYKYTNKMAPLSRALQRHLAAVISYVNRE